MVQYRLEDWDISPVSETGLQDIEQSYAVTCFEQRRLVELIVGVPALSAYKQKVKQEQKVP